MKIPCNQGPISIYGSQEAARMVGGSWTDSKAIHNINIADFQDFYPDLVKRNYKNIDLP
jgi:hypothetical protein